jgi:preprotein translocase subunit SecD
MKKKNLLQRTIIIAIVTLAGIYIVIGPRRRPTLHDFTWSGIKATLASNIHLGLDLKGGTHLVMRVKTDEVLKNLTLADANAIEKAAKDAGLPVKEVMW